MAPKLKIIIGSTRPSRKGPIVAQWAHEAALASEQFEVELVDLASLELPLLDEPNHPAQQKYVYEHTKRWSAIVADADALVFVTPEYDHFPPASLVNAIQCLSREWKYKPAGFVCYGGISGGLRSVQELRLLLANKSVMPLAEVVPVPLFASKIEDERLVANEQMTAGIERMYTELRKWTDALLTLRG